MNREMSVLSERTRRGKRRAAQANTHGSIEAGLLTQAKKPARIQDATN